MPPARPQGHPHSTGPGPPRNRGFGLTGYAPSLGALDFPALDYFDWGPYQELTGASAITAQLVQRTGWGNSVFWGGTDSSAKINSAPNQLIHSGVGTWCGNWIDMRSTDHEFRMRLANTPGGGSVFVWTRVSGEGVINPSGYSVSVNLTSGAWTCDKWINGVNGAALASGTITPAPGTDSELCLRSVGITHEAWYRANLASNWVRLAQFTDNALPNQWAKKVAFEFSAGPTFSLVGGGPVTVDALGQPPATPVFDDFQNTTDEAVTSRLGWYPGSIGGDASMVTDDVSQFAWNKPLPSSVSLDNFNTGANQNVSVRAGWGSGTIGTFSLKTDAGPTYASTLNGTDAGNVWAANLTTDHECYFTFGSVQGTTMLFARMDSSSAPSQGYVGYVSSGNYEIQTWAGATLAKTAGPGNAAGDSYRLRCVGSRITLDYRVAGGNWFNLLSVYNTLHTTGTFVGLYVASGAPRIDDFGGGAIAAASTEAINFWGRPADSADTSAWVKFGPSINSFFWLWCRTQYNSTGIGDGYFLYCDVSGYGELWKRVAGASTLLASGSRVGAWQPGDRALVQAVGSTISAYYDPGNGSFVPFIQATDSSITAAGSIGLQVPAATATTFDVFGGGPFTSGDPGWVVVIGPASSRSLPLYKAPLSRSILTTDSGVAAPDIFASNSVSRSTVSFDSPNSRITNVFDPAANTFADWTPPPIINTTRPLLFNAGRATFWASVSPDLAALPTPQSPPRLPYSAPRSVTLGTFDPAYNTFADWAPTAFIERGMLRYPAPLSRIFSVFDTPAVASTDAMPISAISRFITSAFYPDSIVMGAADEAIPGDFSLVALSRIIAKPPKPQNLTVFAADNTPVSTDMVPLVTLSRILAAQARPISVTVFFGDNPPAASLGATSRQDTKPAKQRSLTILTTDSPVFGTDWASTAQSRRTLNYAPQRGLVVSVLDDSYFKTYAFVTQSRMVPLFDPQGSLFVYAFDGPSGVVVETVSAGGGGQWTTVRDPFDNDFVDPFHNPFRPRVGKR